MNSGYVHFRVCKPCLCLSYINWNTGKIFGRINSLCRHLEGQYGNIKESLKKYHNAIWFFKAPHFRITALSVYITNNVTNDNVCRYWTFFAGYRGDIKWCKIWHKSSKLKKIDRRTSSYLENCNDCKVFGYC